MATESIYEWKDLPDIWTGGDVHAKCGEYSPDYTIANALTTGEIARRWLCDENAAPADHTGKMHWFIVQLDGAYRISGVRGYSNTLDDPFAVDVYVAASDEGDVTKSGDEYSVVPGGWGDPINGSDIADWISANGTTYSEHIYGYGDETDFEVKEGAWILVHVKDAEDITELKWGGGNNAIFQLLCKKIDSTNKVTITYANPDEDVNTDWDSFGTGASRYERVARGSGTEEGLEKEGDSVRQRLGIPPMAPQGDPIAVRVWHRGTRYGSGDSRNGQFGINVAGDYYYEEAHSYTDSVEYYYAEWQLNPATGTAWTQYTIIDVIEFCLLTAKAAIDNGGGKVCEAWAEVVAVDDDTSQRYLTHGVLYGGCSTPSDNNATVKIWSRLSGAGILRIAYGKVEADVKSSTDPDNPTSGVTVTAGSTANSANDYCVTETISGLEDDTTYYYNYYVDDKSVYQYEYAANTFCDWDTLPSFTTFPIEDTGGTFAWLFSGDDHNWVVNYRIHQSMMAIPDTTPRAMVHLGDQHSMDSHNLDLVSDDDKTWGKCHWYGYRRRRGFQVPAKHMSSIYKTIPMFRIWSDHDFVGDDSGKTGYKLRKQFVDGSYPAADIILTSVDAADDYFQIASASGEAMLQAWNTEFIVEIIDWPNLNGTYLCKSITRSSTTSTIKVYGALPAFEEAPTGATLKFYMHKTFNALKAFKDYTPLPTLAAPEELTGTATGGSETELVDSGASFPSTGTSGVYPGMMVWYGADGTWAFSFVKSVDGDTIILSQALSCSKTFAGGGASYRIGRGGLWHSFKFGKTEFFVIDGRYKRDCYLAGPGADMLDGTLEGVDPKASGTVTSSTQYKLVDSGATFITDGVVVGDAVYDTTDGHYALVKAVDSETQLSLEDKDQNDKHIFGGTEDYEIYESGASEHGSSAANINAGHVQRQWLIDGIANSTATWKDIVAEQPFVGIGELHDRWADYDETLQASKNYIGRNINNEDHSILWISSDQHFGTLYDGSGNEDWPWINASAAPLGCEFATIAVPTVDWVVHSDGTKFAGWGRECKLLTDNGTAEFVLGDRVVGQTSGARGVIDAISQSGESPNITAEMNFNALVGTFQDDESVLGDIAGSALANGASSNIDRNVGCFCLVEIAGAKATLSLRGPDGAIIDNSSMDIVGMTNLGSLTITVSWITLLEAADGVSVGDAMSWSFIETLLDGLQISEAINIKSLISTAIIDGIKLAEALAGHLVLDIAATDGMAAGDLPGSQAIFGATALDGMHMGDQEQNAGIFPMTVADAAQISELLSVFRIMPVTATDGIEGSDATKGEIAAVEVVLDGVTVGETLGEDYISNPLVGDGITFGDLLASTAIQGLIAADGIRLGDGSNYGNYINEFLYETANIGDVAATIGAFNASSADGISLGDIVNYTMTYVAAVLDGIRVAEQILTNHQAGLEALDGLDFGDLPYADAFFEKLVSDGIVFSDQTLIQVILSLIQLFVTDGVTLGDSAGYTHEHILTALDGIELGEATATQVNYTITVADAAQLGDVIANIAQLGVVLTDGFKMGDLSIGAWTQGGVKIAFTVKNRTFNFTIKTRALNFTADNKDLNFTVKH